MSVQRYAFDAFGPVHPGGVIIHADDGPYVSYEDHERAVAEAYKRGCALAKGEAVEHYQQGYAAAIADAAGAVMTVMEHSLDCYADGGPCVRCDVAGAIEALGGER